MMNYSGFEDMREQVAELANTMCDRNIPANSY